MGVNTCYRAIRAVPNEAEYCTTNPRHQFDISTNQAKTDPLRLSRDRDIVRNGLPLGQGAADTEENFSPSQHSQKVEIEAIQQALEKTSWNKSAETRKLGMSFRHRLKKPGLE